MRIKRLVVVAPVALAMILILGAAGPVPGTRAGSQDTRVEIQARNVNLRLADGIVVEIRTMRGRMEPRKEREPVTFDDPKSFDVDAAYAVVAISTSTLERLLNGYAFAYDHSPVKNLKVTTSGDRLIIKGTVHKGIDLSFTIEGTPVANGQGQIQIHPQKVTSAHLPLKGLLHLFGKDLADLINTNEARGVRIEGDDMILYPSRITPPPHINGRLTQVRIEGTRIIEVFGTAKAVAPLSPPRNVFNYIYHRGGVLRFGKLTMNDADLEIIGQNQRHAFEFDLPHYNRQLVAGYSKNTPDHGLLVFMPDERPKR